MAVMIGLDWDFVRSSGFRFGMGVSVDVFSFMRYRYACEVFIWTLAMGSGVPEMRDGILFVMTRGCGFWLR